MSHNQQEEIDTYVIPPNFLPEGTFWGGMLKVRNTLEAGAIALVIGLPICKLALPLTTRIIMLCLTALPASIFALVGIGGESLSSFALNFLHFLRSRRILGVQEEEEKGKKAHCRRGRTQQNASPPTADDEEFSAAPSTLSKGKKHATSKCEPRQKRHAQTMADYFPIEKIEHGVIFTKDHRYIKILEVTPINFFLRSVREQRNIIYSYISYLKISPVKVQMKVLTKKADINRYLAAIQKEMETEPDEKCRELQADHAKLIREIGSKEAVTRRFFLVFEHENIGRKDAEAEAISALVTAAQTAKTYLLQCGNTV